MNIAEFLTARYDEREAAAKLATPGPWSVDNEDYAEAIRGGDGYTDVVAGGRWGGEASVFDSTADALFIAANDPAFVLADIAAKRAILELHEPVPYYGTDRYGRWLPRTGVPKMWYCGYCQVDDGFICGEMPCDTQKLLALPLADHPDYNDVWRP